MTQYRLHYFPESGNSFKLAIMLRLCGEAFEPVWTDFAAGITRTAEWRAHVNPMGEIPVLEQDGAKLTQTGPILLSLAERYGRFGGRDERERFQILRWLFWDNQKLSGFMAAYRFRRAFTPSPDPAIQAFLKARVDDCLGILDGEVATRPFIIGEHPTVADLSMCGYLVHPREECGYDFARDYPAIDAWLGRLAALPGWQKPYDLLPGPQLPRYLT